MSAVAIAWNIRRRTSAYSMRYGLFNADPRCGALAAAPLKIYRRIQNSGRPACFSAAQRPHAVYQVKGRRR